MTDTTLPPEQPQQPPHRDRAHRNGTLAAVPAPAAPGPAASSPQAAAPQPSGGRDGRGRFLRGNPGGPGRKPGQGLDLRALAQREAEREGFDLNAAAWRVLKKLFALAEGGDVAAARELFGRIGMIDDAQSASVQLVVVTGVDAATGEPAKGIALRVTATAAAGEPNAGEPNA